MDKEFSASLTPAEFWAVRDALKRLPMLTDDYGFRSQAKAVRTFFADRADALVSGFDMHESDGEVAVTLNAKDAATVMYALDALDEMGEAFGNDVVNTVQEGGAARGVLSMLPGFSAAVESETAKVRAQARVLYLLTQKEDDWTEAFDLYAACRKALNEVAELGVSLESVWPEYSPDFPLMTAMMRNKADAPMTHILREKLDPDGLSLQYAREALIEGRMDYFESLLKERPTALTGELLPNVIGYAKREHVARGVRFIFKMGTEGVTDPHPPLLNGLSESGYGFIHHIAHEREGGELMEEWVKLGGRINALSKNGESALALLCDSLADSADCENNRTGHVAHYASNVRKLLALGADPTIPNRFGYAPDKILVRATALRGCPVEVMHLREELADAAKVFGERRKAVKSKAFVPSSRAAEGGSVGRKI